MLFTFEPIDESHFSLLLKWLESPFIKVWWDPEITWTHKLIEEKYGTYVKGYKKIILAGKVIERPISAFIILLNSHKIGYIQYYDFYDFPREYSQVISGLPANLAAIDMFLGEKNLMGKGIGPALLEQFLKEYVFKKFDAVFVDPESANKNAIRAYEKAGFVRFKQIQNGNITCMIRAKEGG